MDRSQLSSPWWLSGTPLEAEHARLMQRRNVDIPWDQCRVHELTADERARLGKTWMTRSQAEYLAISTFAILSVDLTAAGAPADMLSLCHRAAIDEVRHAELCIRAASLYTGKQELPIPGMSNLPNDTTVPKLHQALANTLLVSCISETYATTILAETRDRTTDPCIREVLTAIYSDEIMHARMGWAYLRYCLELDQEGITAAASEMIRIGVEGVARVVETPRRNDAMSDAMRAHGTMLPAEERVIFAQCIDEVIAPGFEALGVPVGDIRERYGPEWAAQPPPALAGDAGDQDSDVLAATINAPLTPLERH